MKLVKDKHGLWTRKDTYDEKTIKEAFRCYKHLNYLNQKVLDIGANIGGFAEFALNRGARLVICVEPEPTSLRILKINMKGKKVKVVEGAVHNTRQSMVNLYSPKDDYHMGIASTEISRGRRDPIRVVTLDFLALIEKYKPDIVKIDCEGAEYVFLPPKYLPSYVKGVTMELHLNRNSWRGIDAPRIVNFFSDWETVVEPVIGPRNWTTLGTWKR